MANGVRDRRPDPDRRVVHHDVRDLEHRLGNGLAPGDDGLALLPDQPQAYREDDAEGDDLKHVAACHCLDHRLGDDVEKDLVPGLRLGGDLGLRTHRQVDADAGLDDVDGHEADDEGDGGDDLEVDDRANTHPADDLHVAGAGDAGDERREDQRGDDHLDHPEEELAEGAEVDRPLGMEAADQPACDDAEGQSDEDLLCEGNAATRRCSHPPGILARLLASQVLGFSVLGSRFIGHSTRAIPGPRNL